MKVELPYFFIGNSLGGQQDWLPEYMMRIGCCAAVTACDCSIYFELYKGVKNLYPFDKKKILKNDYIKFTDAMKPYLHRRLWKIFAGSRRERFSNCRLGRRRKF